MLHVDPRATHSADTRPAAQTAGADSGESSAVRRRRRACPVAARRRHHGACRRMCIGTDRGRAALRFRRRVREADAVLVPWPVGAGTGALRLRARATRALAQARNGRLRSLECGTATGRVRLRRGVRPRAHAGRNRRMAGCAGVRVRCTRNHRPRAAGRFADTALGARTRHAPCAVRSGCRVCRAQSIGERTRAPAGRRTGTHISGTPRRRDWRAQSGCRRASPPEGARACTAVASRSGRWGGARVRAMPRGARHDRSSRRTRRACAQRCAASDRGFAFVPATFRWRCADPRQVVHAAGHRSRARHTGTRAGAGGRSRFHVGEPESCACVARRIRARQSRRVPSAGRGRPSLVCQQTGGDRCAQSATFGASCQGVRGLVAARTEASRFGGSIAARVAGTRPTLARPARDPDPDTGRRRGLSTACPAILRPEAYDRLQQHRHSRKYTMRRISRSDGNRLARVTLLVAGALAVAGCAAGYSFVQPGAAGAGDYYTSDGPYPAPGYYYDAGMGTYDPYGAGFGYGSVYGPSFTLGFGSACGWSCAGYYGGWPWYYSGAGYYGRRWHHGHHRHGDPIASGPSPRPWLRPDHPRVPPPQVVRGATPPIAVPERPREGLASRRMLESASFSPRDIERVSQPASIPERPA